MAVRMLGMSPEADTMIRFDYLTLGHREIYPFSHSKSYNACCEPSHREDLELGQVSGGHSTVRQEVAALRDFAPADVRSGSSSTEAVEVPPRCMSALARKRSPAHQIAIRRWVPSQQSSTMAVSDARLVYPTAA